MKQKIHILFPALILASILFACNNSDDLTLGANFVDNTTKIMQVDTFSVEMSTIVLDSIETSGTGISLVGYYEDENFGKITASSYSQIGLPVKTYLDVYEDDVYDSITLVLYYSNYSYGDTNVLQEFEIYELKEKMIRTNVDDYYNTSDIAIESYPIGSIKYYPRPIGDTLIEIRIDDELGKDIFNKLKYDEEEVSSSDYFQEYIYGFALMPDKSKSSSIIAFDQTNLNFRLYTSRLNENTDQGSEQIIYKFPSTGYQFNQIKSDRTNTLLEDLTSTNSLSSSQTNNRTYIQAGVGMLTKIEFPYLNMLLFDESKLIISVNLVLKVEEESYDGEFPSEFYLYETDKYNEFDIDEDDNLISISLFNLDEMYHINTYYAFDITSFLQDQIDDNYIDTDRGIIVTIPSTNFNSTLDCIVLSSDSDLDRKPRLIINYIEI